MEYIKFILIIFQILFLFIFIAIESCVFVIALFPNITEKRVTIISSIISLSIVSLLLLHNYLPKR